MWWSSPQTMAYSPNCQTMMEASEQLLTQMAVKLLLIKKFITLCDTAMDMAMITTNLGPLTKLLAWHQWHGMNTASTSNFHCYTLSLDSASEKIHPSLQFSHHLNKTNASVFSIPSTNKHANFHPSHTIICGNSIKEYYFNWKFDNIATNLISVITTLLRWNFTRMMVGMIMNTSALFIFQTFELYDSFFSFATEVYDGGYTCMLGSS